MFSWYISIIIILLKKSISYFDCKDVTLVADKQKRHGSFDMYDCLKQPVRNLVEIMRITTEEVQKFSADGIHTCGNSTAFQSSIQSSIGLNSGDKYILVGITSTAFQSTCDRMRTLAQITCSCWSV